MDKNQPKQIDASNTVNSWSIFKSALAGLIGIQKRENLERDFQSGKFWHFFIAGAIVTLLFMGVVGLFVTLMLKTAGA